MTIAYEHELPDGFEALKVLGRGGEGTILLVSHSNDTQKYVLKVFHDPLPKAWAVGLQIYAREIAAGEPGLMPITLWESKDSILGVYYPHVRLIRVHPRLVSSLVQVARGVVGSFCRMQRRLIAEHGVAVLEPSAANMLLTEGGYFCYVDFGYGISTLDQPEMRRLNLMGYGFAALLTSLRRKSLRQALPPSEEHDYAAPCVYFENELLDEAAAGQPWIAEIVAEVRGSPAERLLEAGFYEGLGRRLPGRVASARALIAANKLLDKVARVRRQMKRVMH